MNYCANKQHNAFGASENMRRNRSVNVPLAVSSDSRDSVVCPKPRRFGLLDESINDPTVKPLRWRWHYNQQLDCCDSRAGTDLLDIILSNSMMGIGDGEEAEELGDLIAGEGGRMVIGRRRRGRQCCSGPG